MPVFIILFGLLPLCLYSQSEKISIGSDLYLKSLTPNVWIHVSTVEMPPWGPVSANGMAIVTENQLVLVDTPWNNRQTSDLINWFQEKFTIGKIHVIATHFHQDNLGGLEWVHSQGFASHGEAGDLSLIDHTLKILRDSTL